VTGVIVELWNSAGSVGRDEECRRGRRSRGGRAARRTL
jgi:hypothetical protein